MANVEDIDVINLQDADNVEVFVDRANKLWVDVNGKCLLSIEQIKSITLTDPLRGKAHRKLVQVQVEPDHRGVGDHGLKKQPEQGQIVHETRSNVDVTGQEIVYGPTKISKGVKSTGMILRPRKPKRKRKKTMNARKLAFLHMYSVLTGTDLTAEEALELSGENVTETQLAKAQEIVKIQADRIQKRLGTIATREKRREARKKERAKAKPKKAKAKKPVAKKSPAKRTTKKKVKKTSKKKS